jgi:hypothetical protein
VSVWFEGRSEVRCTLAQVAEALDDLGEHYVGVVGLMPGLSSVELVDQGPDHVTIRTSEGLMKRTHITRTVEADRVVVEFDEEYEAGAMVTTRSHFMDEFSSSDTGVIHHTVMSGVEARGLLGFVYRKFGSSNIGNAFLTAYKTYLEAL